MNDIDSDLRLHTDVSSASRLVSQAVLTAHQAGHAVAEFAATALARTAATLGSVEVPLRNRSGSWEAAAVRDLLLGTVGRGGEYLADHYQPELDERLRRRQGES